jgi:hypothetical protein
LKRGKHTEIIAQCGQMRVDEFQGLVKLGYRVVSSGLREGFIRRATRPARVAGPETRLALACRLAAQPTL